MPKPRLLLVLLLVAAGTVAAAQPGGAEAEPALDGASDATTRVVAYYFHGNVRCATCRKLEAYSEEAITEGFPGELAEGRLVWRAVNVDEPDNARFVRDFELVSKAVVLVRYRGEEVVGWRNLGLIWQLVRSREGFLAYVRDETRRFLAEG